MRLRRQYCTFRAPKRGLPTRSQNRRNYRTGLRYNRLAQCDAERSQAVVSAAFGASEAVAVNVEVNVNVQVDGLRPESCTGRRRG
jgi:hypothetical protein